MLPFTSTQFFAVFSEYNIAVAPAQVVLLAVAVAIIAAGRWRPVAMWPGLALGVLWIWMGVVYHVTFFAPINPAAYAFALAFVVQGMSLALLAAQGALRFAIPRDPLPRWTGAALLVYALVAYPLIGYAAGQRYPQLPTFGVPCPTVIFTFGMLAWTVTPVSPFALVIPVLWAMIASTAAMQMGVVQDWALPLAAAVLLALRIGRRVESAELAVRDAA